VRQRAGLTGNRKIIKNADFRRISIFIFGTLMEIKKNYPSK
jgi:hypothetical protein